jgi:5'-nucleotidase
MDPFRAEPTGRTGNRHPRLAVAPVGESMTDRTGATPTRLVLFDMDDTLFDHRHAVRESLAAGRREDPRLAARPLGGLLAEYDRLLDEVHPDVLAGRATHAEARRERFRRLYDWAGATLDEQEAEVLSRRYRARYQRFRRPVAGAPALLRALCRAVPVGIVSNNHTDEQRDKMAAIGIEASIRFLVASEDVGVGKPDPAIFLRALELGGVDASETVMVGDNWEADIVGASAAGIRPFWLNRTGRTAPASDRPVPELRDLRPVRTVAPILLAGAAGATVGGRRNRPL